MPRDAPAETWALNEHPLQLCCQLRQPGQTTWDGREPQTEDLDQGWEFCLVSSPVAITFKSKLVQIGFRQAKFERLFWKSTKPVRRGLKTAGVMKITLVPRVRGKEVRLTISFKFSCWIDEKRGNNPIFQNFYVLIS